MKKLNNIEKNKISKIKILNSSVKDKSQSEVKNSKNTNFTLIQSKKSNEVKRNFCVNTTNEYITVKLNKNNIKNTGKINLISSKKNKLIDKGLDENYVQTENTLKVRPFTKDEVFSTKQDLIKMSSNNFSVGNSENFKIFKEKETTYSKNIKLQSQNETVNIIPSEALNSNSSRKSDNMNKYLARKLFLPSSIHNLKNKDLIVILNFLSYKEIHLIINSNTIFSNRVSKLIQKTAKNLENNISQNLQKFNQFDLFECFIISTTQGLKLFCILKRKEISENINMIIGYIYNDKDNKIFCDFLVFKEQMLNELTKIYSDYESEKIFRKKNFFISPINASCTFVSGDILIKYLKDITLKENESSFYINFDRISDNLLKEKSEKFNCFTLDIFNNAKGFFEFVGMDISISNKLNEFFINELFNEANFLREVKLNSTKITTNKTDLKIDQHINKIGNFTMINNYYVNNLNINNLHDSKEIDLFKIKEEISPILKKSTGKIGGNCNLSNNSNSIFSCISKQMIQNTLNTDKIDVKIEKNNINEEFGNILNSFNKYQSSEEKRLFISYLENNIRLLNTIDNKINWKDTKYLKNNFKLSEIKTFFSQLFEIKQIQYDINKFYIYKLYLKFNFKLIRKLLNKKEITLSLFTIIDNELRIKKNKYLNFDIVYNIDEKNDYKENESYDFFSNFFEKQKERKFHVNESIFSLEVTDYIKFKFSKIPSMEFSLVETNQSNSPQLEIFLIEQLFFNFLIKTPIFNKTGYQFILNTNDDLQNISNQFNIADLLYSQNSIQIEKDEELILYIKELN